MFVFLKSLWGLVLICVLEGSNRGRYSHPRGHACRIRIWRSTSHFWNSSANKNSKTLDDLVTVGGVVIPGLSGQPVAVKHTLHMLHHALPSSLSVMNPIKPPLLWQAANTAESAVCSNQAPGGGSTPQKETLRHLNDLRLGGRETDRVELWGGRDVGWEGGSDLFGAAGASVRGANAKLPTHRGPHVEDEAQAAKGVWFKGPVWPVCDWH